MIFIIFIIFNILLILNVCYFMENKMEMFLIYQFQNYMYDMIINYLIN